MRKSKAWIPAGIMMFAILMTAGWAGTDQTDEVFILIVPDAAWRCDKAFDPSVVTIKAGTTVVWMNQDRETHTLVSSKGNQPCYQKSLPPGERVIDAGQVPHRTEYRQTFNVPGEFHYICHLPFHHMAGRIIVVP